MRNKGITLIELLVILTVVAIVAVISILISAAGYFGYQYLTSQDTAQVEDVPAPED